LHSQGRPCFRILSELLGIVNQNGDTPGEGPIRLR
jgi:hypothetical protein